MVRAKGIKRREALTKAAARLVALHSVEEIGFRDIAQAAQLPVSSAYHFFANKYDVFSTLANLFLERLEQVLAPPVPASQVSDWPDLVDVWIDRTVQFFQDHPAARAVLLGSTIPLEIKLDDNDRIRGRALMLSGHFEQHFIVPEVDQLSDKLKYGFLIVDSLLTAGLREKGELIPQIVDEAKRAYRGYLATYFTEPLTLRTVSDSGWDSFPL